MSRVMVFLTWYLRHGSKECDSSSPPARSSPHEFCRPNAARDVSRPVGTRGGVGWMRGPGACPRPGELIQRVSMKPWRTRHSPGQAPGPHPSPHPPLVPTERRGRSRPDARRKQLRFRKDTASYLVALEEILLKTSLPAWYLRTMMKAWHGNV